MITLSTYASGYAAYYKKDTSSRCPYRSKGGCDEHEIYALEHRGELTFDPQNPERCWWPRTPDFLAEAAKHGRATGVKNMASLIQAVKIQRNINKVLWFGHGSKGELHFGTGGRFTSSDIALLPDLSASFAPGGEVYFYACNSGQLKQFYQSMANKLRVKVLGFSSGVKWNLSWDGEKPHRLITVRGITGELPKPDITCTPQ